MRNLFTTRSCYRLKEMQNQRLLMTVQRPFAIAIRRVACRRSYTSARSHNSVLQCRASHNIEYQEIYATLQNTALAEAGSRRSVKLQIK
jgi:hypothetical protein